MSEEHKKLTRRIGTSDQIDLSPVAAMVAARSPFGEGDVIDTLQAMQGHYGYLPRAAMDELARRSGIPVAKLYGVATFYAQFHLQPHGKHVIRVCRGTACHVRGASGLLSTLCRHLGIEDGGTTPDRFFSMESVACLGTCFLAPVMLVDDCYFGKLTAEKAVAAIEKLRDRNGAPQQTVASTTAYPESVP